MKSSDFVLRSDGNFRWLNFPVLDRFEFLLHGFIIKGKTHSGKVQENPERFFEEHFPRSRAAIRLRQIHSDECIAITPKDKIRKMYEGDAILTNRKDVLISIQVADCVPVFLVEVKGRVIGLIHAGWKGAALGIAQSAVRTARERFNCQPGDITAVFGPSIRSCCYPVADAVAILFDEKLTRRFARGNRALDLVGACVQQLADCGVKKERMFVTDTCTACDSRLFHSFRREGEETGRMVGYLGLK